MHIQETATLPAPPERVFDFVDDLAAYPQWLRLVDSVRSVEPESDGSPAWQVELRARIGPFARSKQLRMVRTQCDPAKLAVFERTETDDKQHAMWALRAELEPVDDGRTALTMHLYYEGDVWGGGGVIRSVLNEEVKRGRSRLIDLLTANR